MMMARSPRGRILRILAILVFVAGGGLLIAYAGRDKIEELVVPPAQSGTPMPAAAAVSAKEQAFFNYVGARLRALTAEAEVLIKLGDERSRNLVELQVRSDRVIELADQIDAYIRSGTVPARFAAAVDLYRTGIVEVRTGIADAKSSVFRFDWDAVAAALDVFEKGTIQLDTSYRVLRDIVSSGGTPVSGLGIVTAVAVRRRTYRSA